MKRLLIIKTGRNETFAESEVTTPSLGDVLRTTVLLPAFHGFHITWLTSLEAQPLLSGNPLINEVLFQRDPLSNLKSSFDVVVNLERDEDSCQFLAQAPASEKYGFINSDGHRLIGLETICPPLHLTGEMPWQMGLFKMIAREWTGEEYSIAEPSGDGETHDVGLNWAVGSKWPTKCWRKNNWTELEKKLSAHYSTSWQRGFDSIEEYVQWIGSCRTIVTTDSLGLHIAVALKKNVLALMGPTSSQSIHLYGRGTQLTPEPSMFPCAPCSQPSCAQSVSCMDALSVDRVYHSLVHLIARAAISQTSLRAYEPQRLRDIESST